MNYTLIKEDVIDIIKEKVMETKLAIQFFPEYVLKNEDKLTDHNWKDVIARSNIPARHDFGCKEIKKEMEENGVYHEMYKLHYEPKRDSFPAGYIFREINHKGGISGIHKTVKEAIWRALELGKTVWLEEY